MASRNSYLTTRAMTNCLFASILTMCANQLNVTIDGIIVSNFAGPNALSAVNLFTPISLAIQSIASLLGIGATIVASRYMGQRKMDEANNTVSTAIVSIVVAGVCFGLLTFLFKGAITDFICSEDALKENFMSYMVWMSGFGVITMFSLVSNQMASIDGRPDLVTKAVFCEMAANVTMDILFVYYLHWGIAGSAIATLLSVSLNIAVLWSYILSPRSAYHIRPLKDASMSCLKRNMQQGTSLIIGNLILMIMFLFLNGVTQSKQGVNGIFALSVCMNLLSIGMMFSSGISTALMSIGSFLFGQHDMQGLKFIVNRSIVFLETAILVLVVIIEIYPSLISGLFGADSSELLAYTNDSLRRFVWILPPVLLALVLANVYQVIGRLVLSPVLVLTFPLILIPNLYVVPAIMGDDCFWYAFPITGLIILLLAMGITAIVCMKEKGLYYLTLIPCRHANVIYDESVKCNHDSVVKSIGHLSQVMKSTAVVLDIQERIRHCIEELELNILGQVQEKESNKYFDVLITIEEDKILASIKDKGKPFDPVHFSEEKRGMGLNILFGFSDEVDYKYMYGQNMTFIKWKANRLKD